MGPENATGGVHSQTAFAAKSQTGHFLWGWGHLGLGIGTFLRKWENGPGLEFWTWKMVATDSWGTPVNFFHVIFERLRGLLMGLVNAAGVPLFHIEISNRSFPKHFLRGKVTFSRQR